MTHSFAPWRTARVSSAVMSEPWPDSVKAPAESILPSATAGRNFCFSSSLPKRSTLGGKTRQDHGTASARIPGAELFGDQDVFHHAQPLARIRLRIVHADETQLGELSARSCAGIRVSGRVRGQALCRIRLWQTPWPLSGYLSAIFRVQNPLLPSQLRLVGQTP